MRLENFEKAKELKEKIEILEKTIKILKKGKDIYICKNYVSEICMITSFYDFHKVISIDKKARKILIDYYEEELARLKNEFEWL